MSTQTTPAYNYRFLWTICLVAAMGGLLFGYDWVVIGGAKVFYQPYFEIASDAQWFYQGWATSSALVGCLLGAVVSGILTDRWGRKRLLISAGFLFVLSAVGTALAWDFSSFNVFRLIGGMGIGLASNLSPMYIAEVSPANARGRFVSVNQLTIVIGILLAQIVNWLLAAPVPTADQIRLVLNEESAALTAAGVPGFNLEDARREALELVDEQMLANVKQRFPNIEYVVLGETATSEEKKVKADTDAEIMAIYIRPTWNGRVGWRWMFGAEVVPAFLFFLLMFFVPESPRWLLKYGREEEAARILTRVGGADYARAELTDVKATLSAEEIARVRFSDLREPRMSRILALGVFLAVFQQWCGINVIFTYAEDIFKAAGYGVSGIMFNVVVTGVVNLLFTFIAIATVDRFGRRPLMLLGAAGLAGIYAVLGLGYYLESTGPHMLLLVVAAIGCYSMSLAPVTWVVISEIFPNRIRGAAMSVAVFSLWLGCMLLTFTFPLLKNVLGAYGAFWLYGLICLAGFSVIFRKLPETKGKSLEDIERELVD